VILVMMNGGPVDLTDQKKSKNIDGILWVGYPGQSGGQAIAQTLFGDFNPGGRLPYTIYPGDYVNQISMFDMGFRPNKTNDSPGRSYRFYIDTPVYEFGTGLSYSNFTYQWMNDSNYTSFWEIPMNKRGDFQQLRAGEEERENIISFSGDQILAQYQENQKISRRHNPRLDPVYSVTCNVTNLGPYDASHSVLAFLVPPNAGKNGVPLKFLFGFDRVYLQKGESKILPFSLGFDQMVMGTRNKQYVLRGLWNIVIDQPTAISFPLNVF